MRLKVLATLLKKRSRGSDTVCEKDGTEEERKASSSLSIEVWELQSFAKTVVRKI